MNKAGVVSVKVLLMMMTIVLVFSTLLAGLRQGFTRNNHYRNQLMISQSILASYDTYLYVNYGLYGFSDVDDGSYIEHDMFEPTQYQVKVQQPLSDSHVVKKQIIDFMTYRMPANYMAVLMNKMDVIESASSTSKIIDHKHVVDVALSDLDHLYESKNMLAVKVNGLDKQVVETLLDMDKDKVEGLLDQYLDLNKSLFDDIIKMDEKTNEINLLIDTTIDVIQGERNGLEIVKDQVIDSLLQSQTDLFPKPNSETYCQAFLTEISSHTCHDYWYPTLHKIYHNKLLIQDVIDLIKQSENTLDYQKSIERLFSYQSIHVNESKGNAYKTYYEQELNKKEERGTIDSSGKKIESQLHKTRHRAEFWSVLSYPVESMIDDLMVNEYIIASFRSFAEPSETDFDYFNKYDRSHYFNRAEIEYILIGDDYESLNISKTYGVLFGVRTLMNGLHVYTDKEKLALSESIGLGVAGWTGFGAPLISNMIRIAWSTGESVYDLKALLAGESIPFYKFSAEEWHYDLGLAYEHVDMPDYMNMLSLTYHDYLRFMLMTLDTDTKVKRISNLIELDLNFHQKSLMYLFSEVYVGDVQNGYEK